MRVADFFCGAGGFSEGFRQAGFRTIFAVDKWLPAVNTHHGNHPYSNTILDDVERISLLPDIEFHELVPDTEIIIGSPPCVAFSNSNKSGKADKELGLRLLESYLRIVARKKFKTDSILKYWILENVPNIEKYVKPIYTAQDLKINGEFSLNVVYDNSGVYNAKFFGVAQNRKRFLCGEFPTPQPIVNEEEIMPLRVILDSLRSPCERNNLPIKDPNYTFTMMPQEVTDHHYIKELAEYEWKKAKQLKEDKGYMGRMAFPEDVNKPARTVMANSSVSSRESIIYSYTENRYRMPTVRELASIMSFPIDYRFYGASRGIKSKLVGNAVPPKMAYAFAKAIAITLNLPIPEQYIMLDHPIDMLFKNLNNTVFDINIEKSKKEGARFKHHIPYLIINAFRVELTNYSSDFENKNYNWKVEIHKSQGPKAKVYTPPIDSNWLNSIILNKIEEFLISIEEKLVSFNEFQQNHCFPSYHRLNKGLWGPEEVLEHVKNFILNMADYFEYDSIELPTSPYKLPISIATGYIVLTLIINKMRGIDNGYTVKN